MSPSLFNKNYLAASVAALMSVGAAASNIDADSVRIGVFELTPTLNMSTSYNDNLYKQDKGAKDSWIARVKPSFELLAQDGDDYYLINYDIEGGSYISSHNDDYVDHNLEGVTYFQLGRRNALTLDASYHRGHDDRGTAFTDGEAKLSIDKPDQWEEANVGGLYAFGAKDSKGRLEIGGDYATKSYTNHHSPDKGNADTRDYDKSTGIATFYWQVMPKTSLLIEGEYQDFDYDKDANGFSYQLDSTQTTGLIGLKWDITGKTTGIAKFGYRDKDFDANELDDFNGTAWMAQIQWSPLERSVVDVITSRNEKESTGKSAYIDSKDIAVDWTHSWSSLLKTKAGVRFARDEYSDGVDRNDDIENYSLGVSYSLMRQLSVGVNYEYDNRDSNLVGFDYDRNVVAFVVELGL